MQISILKTQVPINGAAPYQLILTTFYGNYSVFQKIPCTKELLQPTKNRYKPHYQFIIYRV